MKNTSGHASAGGRAEAKGVATAKDSWPTLAIPGTRTTSQEETPGVDDKMNDEEEEESIIDDLDKCPSACR